MTITSIVYIFTGIFEAIVSLMFINTYNKSANKPFAIYFITAIVLALMINVSNFILNYGFLNVIFVLISIFIIAFVYSRNIRTSIMNSIILVLIFLMTEIVTLFIITFLSGITVEQATNIESYKILGTILSKLFAFIIIKFICLKHKSTSIMKTSYWILCFTIFAISAIAIYLLFIFQYNSTTSSIYDNLAVWCSCGLLYNTFFSLYLYENIAKQADIERKQELFKQQIKAQSKHLDEILISQKQMKKLRHDLINHNISLQAYFENQDYASGLEYLKSMNPNDMFSDNMIETGNVALDAIMNTKKSIAISKNIEFDTKIQIPEDIFVDAIDICIIFGNALDNCIEACDKIENGPKKISVSIIYEDESLICKIVNTAIKSNSRFLHTTKLDNINHGFGIGNIESALEKYKNICRFKQSDAEFILSFVIFKN